MKKNKILVVEDEKAINDLIAMSLKKDGFEIEQVFDGHEAVKKINENQYLLVVLDWMLPHVSGLEILEKVKDIKTKNGFGVLMVTAKSQPEDIVMGLDSGADDYISKPFDLNVLRARVKAVLRRNGSDIKPQAPLSIGGLTLNTETHEVRCGSDKVDLTISEFKLLHSLLLNPEKVMTRKQLVAEIQGEGVVVVDRSIDTHMVGLRKKLGECSNLVQTVRGVGYRLTHEPHI